MEEGRRDALLDLDESVSGLGRSSRVDGPVWSAVAALALALVALSVVHPVPLVVVPLVLMLVALPPRRPMLLGLAVVLGAIAFTGPSTGPIWYVERGWSLVLGAWFVVSLVVWPSSRFLPRALAALGAALSSAGLLFVVGRDQAWARIDWLIGQRFRSSAADAAALWSAAGPADVPWAESLSDALFRAAELQALVYPALIALASLAGLGLAWWTHRWLTMRERRPLALFREFRFRDELVWLLIVGLLLVVLPLGGGMLRTGSNILTFMVVLYALRGAAVLLVAVGGFGLGGAVAAVLAVLFLYPLVVAGTVLIGLSDTWLDLRSRARSAVDGGS